jgi:hypothetical protein
LLTLKSFAGKMPFPAVKSISIHGIAGLICCGHGKIAGNPGLRPEFLRCNPSVRKFPLKIGAVGGVAARSQEYSGVPPDIRCIPRKCSLIRRKIPFVRRKTRFARGRTGKFCGRFRFPAEFSASAGRSGFSAERAGFPAELCIRPPEKWIVLPASRLLLRKRPMFRRSFDFADGKSDSSSERIESSAGAADFPADVSPDPQEISNFLRNVDVPLNNRIFRRMFRFVRWKVSMFCRRIQSSAGFVDTSAERFDFPQDSILRGQKTVPSTERAKKESGRGSQWLETRPDSFKVQLNADD